MQAPALLANLADHVAVAVHGGVRVRIRIVDGKPVANVLGRTVGAPPDRLKQLVLELAPDACGTVDLRNDGRGNWWIRASSSLAADSFVQRLRNVLVSS